MNKLEGIFVYDIDDLQAVAAAHMAERSREASDAETLIAGEVERFQQNQRTVNVAPAIVALQAAGRGDSAGRIAAGASSPGFTKRGADCRRGNADPRVGKQISSSAHAGPETGGPRGQCGAARCAL